MAGRPIHPSKEIEAAIKFAESRGWRYQKSGKSAHAWGRLFCPFAEREGCALSIWSTPNNVEAHARQILRQVTKCPHRGGAMTRCTKDIYTFLLVLASVDENTPELEDKLFEAGCDDAIILYKNGVVCLEFDRKAISLHKAIDSAIHDVEKAKIGAVVDHIEGGYVTLSDIAEKTNKTRQSISLLVKGERGPGGFPVPFCNITGSSPIWRWVDVAQWMFKNNKLEDEALVIEAKVINEINAKLQARLD